MKRGLAAHVISYVVVNLAQVVVWRLFTPKHFFWPLYSLGVWGVGLAWHIWAVCSPSRRIPHSPSQRD
ncbi:2TM domain-containing protein [Nonomuraea sp. NPDC003707]